MGAKLDREENVVVVNVTKDMFVDNFLKEFATAFKKEDGVVGFGKAIVGFGRLGDDDHKGVRPRVMTKSDCGIKDV